MTERYTCVLASLVRCLILHVVTPNSNSYPLQLICNCSNWGPVLGVGNGMGITMLRCPHVVIGEGRKVQWHMHKVVIQEMWRIMTLNRIFGMKRLIPTVH